MNAARLQQLWYSGQAPGPALRALEHLYSRLRAFDHKHQLARRAHDLEGRPIIVVGNLVVGGTGKTPLLVRLVELLQAQHLNVAVISRGYGSGRKAPVNVTTESDVAQAGDEPLLIARRTGASVRVDPDREAAARAVLAGGAQVVLSDDGLQRMSLPRALEVCVVDGARGFGNGHLLPAGPLREPPERLASVDWVVCNGEPRAGLDLPGAVPCGCSPAHSDAWATARPAAWRRWLLTYSTRRARPSPASATRNASSRCWRRCSARPGYNAPSLIITPTAPGTFPHVPAPC
jgi:tetraacyldisaccharide 4'-kinase